MLNPNSVQISLSTMCNMVHAECPTTVLEKDHLPLNTVLKVLEELAQIGFAGEVSYHMYSEPLIDPRLFIIIEATSRILPNCIIRIWTNGKNLTPGLCQDFMDYPQIRFTISLYSAAERQRINQLTFAHPPAFHSGSMDDRLALYDWPETEGTKPCNGPASQIVIAPTGEVVICCLDWKKTATFGNVKTEALQDILVRQEAAAKELLEGKRTLPVCKRCPAVR